MLFPACSGPRQFSPKGCTFCCDCVRLYIVNPVYSLIRRVCVRHMLFTTIQRGSSRSGTIIMSQCGVAWLEWPRLLTNTPSRAACRDPTEPTLGKRASTPLVVVQDISKSMKAAEIYWPSHSGTKMVRCVLSHKYCGMPAPTIFRCFAVHR